MTIPYAELRKRWNSDPEFREELATLRPEFELARALIEARSRAGSAQRDVAARHGNESAIGRSPRETGASRP